MNQLTQRGGAQIGWMGASWPFASLQIAPNSLTVSVLGNYAFTPFDVHAIEPVGFIPILNMGIRIHHTRPDYPEKIVFYSIGGRNRLLAAARAAGFPVGQPQIETQRGRPLKLSAMIIFVLLWNVLFLLDRGGNLLNNPGHFGPYSLLALMLAFTAATLMPYSVRLQKFVIHDGHDIGEIRGILRLIQLVTGFLSLSIVLGLLS